MKKMNKIVVIQLKAFLISIVSDNICVNAFLDSMFESAYLSVCQRIFLFH